MKNIVQLIRRKFGLRLAETKLRSKQNEFSAKPLMWLSMN